MGPGKVYTLSPEGEWQHIGDVEPGAWDFSFVPGTFIDRAGSAELPLLER
jgi:hypothetical protein